MRVALLLVVGLAWATPVTTAAAERTKGLSLEQIRGVMRANAAAFNACLRTVTRRGKELHGPFLYQIGVDKDGRVTWARPYQPSAVAAFDKCVTGVLKRARFPGGPANVEAPLVFDPS
jgi:outer membrane biosynthesis protein TonB